MKSDSFKIRKMEKADLPFVAQLERECFSRPWSEKGLESELTEPSAEFFVLEKDGAVAAYMGMHIVLDECYIANVAVSEAFRKRGCGSLLVENAKAVAKKRGCSFITLEVRLSNLPAISLYEKQGFERVGERKNFYSDPTENALIMTKYLTDTETEVNQ